MMQEGVRQLCALSVLCGVALYLAPEGAVKRISSIGCTVILLLSLVNAVSELSLIDYAVELAKYRELSEELSQQADNIQDRLNRTVIEQECGTYILDKAAELGIEDLQVTVTARWDMEGVWVPYKASLRSDCGAEERNRLSERIQAELGIAKEDQEWSGYG